MKLLVLVLEKVGKEPTGWQAECLYLALLLVVMEGDNEQGGTTGEDSGEGFYQWLIVARERD